MTLARTALLLAAPVLIALAPARADATFYLRDDPTGGDCGLIGNWDQGTRTCTMTRDLTLDATVQTGLIIGSPDVTLDGAGHTLTAQGAYTAIACSGGSSEPISRTTIRNLVIEGFNNGIFVENSTGVVIENNVFSAGPGWAAIQVRWSTWLRISGNHMTNVDQGIRLEDVTDSIIQNNYIEYVGFGMPAGGSRNLFTGNDVRAYYTWTAGGAISIAGDDNVVRDNSFQTPARCLLYASGNRNAIFQNNMIGGFSTPWEIGPVQIPATSPDGQTYTGNVLSFDPPVGGNYWSTVACSNVDGDAYCDGPASFWEGAYDRYPWAVANGWRDDDGDGSVLALDCDDSNPAAYPGAPEIMFDGIDQNCNGMGDDDVDADLDGFLSAHECNDLDANIHPGALEVKHDGIDQDCNGYDLTIDVLGATYKTSSGTLKVVATSALGPAATLSVVGFGSMAWEPAESAWIANLPSPGDPGSVTVSGIEGTAAAVTVVR